MRKTMMVASMLAFAFTVSGCGSSGPDALVNEMIQCMNDMADAMEKNTPDKTEAIAKRMKELDEKMKALNLSKEDEAKLKEKHKDALEKAGKRMSEAMLKNVGNMLPGMPALPKTGNAP
jgi:hypothetical protein